jgi:glycosyltransferase involved in cell wall biosynthesis
MSKKLVIIAPVSNLSENVFLAKLEKVVNKLNLTKEFWGWNRNALQDQFNSKQTPSNIDRKILISGGGNANKMLMAWYPFWMIKVFFNAWVESKSTLYFCASFDTALPLALCSLFRKRYFVFANRDNISKIYAWQYFMKKILERLEIFSANQADIHLIPGSSRWDFNGNNIYVLPNTPSSYVVNEAIKIAKNENYKRGEIFTLYVNGWLTSTRGMGTLLKAVKADGMKSVKIIVAGAIHCQEARQLVELPNVDYLGFLSNEEALAIYYKSHLAFTFYDPRLEINRLAEPNKWWDCVVTQTPFITNSEVVNASLFIKRKACFYVNYDDWSGLAQMITELNKNQKKWREVQKNLGEFDVKLWDNAMQQLLEGWLDKDCETDSSVP